MAKVLEQRIKRLEGALWLACSHVSDMGCSCVGDTVEHGKGPKVDKRTGHERGCSGYSTAAQIMRFAGLRPDGKPRVRRAS